MKQIEFKINIIYPKIVTFRENPPKNNIQVISAKTNLAQITKFTRG